jgi:pyruvate formate lyase activating enzyme
LADEPFYEESGGGITFSGGEPLAQGEFVLSALKALAEKGFHSTVDTSGHAPTELVMATIPYTDLYLYDIKYINSEKHAILTGADNKLIHANIKALADCGADVIISVPLIPGYNDDDDNLAETARFIADLKPAGRSSPYPVRILPYHDAARGKYSRRNLRYRCADASPPDAASVERAALAFRQLGIETRTGGLA